MVARPRRNRRAPAAAILALAAAALALTAAGCADGAGRRRADPPPRARWVPAPDTTWQWQLTTPVDQRVDAQLFDIDLFDNSSSVVASLHRHGRHVICYLDAGTYESFRPDASKFPRSLLGNSNGWPGERWLDIRRLGLLEPIMRARLQLCARKHFDGVEADNVDGYANDTGFPLTAAEQLAYDEWLARAAHGLGLSIALKNDLGQVRQLEPLFDYALDEQCFQFTECSLLAPFVAARKAVFEVEYDLTPSQFCARARSDGLMAMRKDLNLDASRQACWG
ncbi:MAG: endo alpha-1,4 polygalactosaminidase [Solirubrobacteraceae bacterium]|jgi:hypothetical protein